ncbi:MAG: TetR/AcrR family transcriptional regulator [Sphingomonadales bacterium]|nr:TetR/AcrR family transcriptional regulator [Sphingomonadales bacterium]MDE2568817.1 TetR/AcrR family transcriptional regulator [Sphingomonadales bacterium]
MDQLADRQFIVPDMVLPEREGGYAKGRETYEQILRAALGILIEEGYRPMSMRRIAAACGMKLGNLTYYFPTREDLVRELLDAVIRSYEIEFDAIVHDPGLSPERRLGEICALILEDIRTKKTTRLFPELWALSNHDAFVFDRVQNLYSRARESLNEIVLEMRSDLPLETREALALFISASMEGLTVFAGYDKPFEPRMPLLSEISVEAFVSVVKGFGRTAG